MGRTANRRAANSANRSLWLNSTMGGLTSGGANPTTWPKREDGTNKIMREMTREEQDRELGKIAEALKSEFSTFGIAVNVDID